MSIQKKPFIFLDFDGTVTERDTIIAMMEEFAPEEWKELKDQTLSRRISVRKGVGAMFSLIPSGKKKEIISFVKEKIKIRQGFREFLEFCETAGFDYKILSGGVDFYIYPLLEKYLSKDKILCNGSDFSSANIQVVWGYACDPYCHLDCGICKVSLIRTYDPSLFRRILIGDSVTDFGAAMVADRVIARDSLLKQCQETGVQVNSFNHFFEVIQSIKNV